MQKFLLVGLLFACVFAAETAAPRDLKADALRYFHAGVELATKVGKDIYISLTQPPLPAIPFHFRPDEKAINPPLPVGFAREPGQNFYPLVIFVVGISCFVGMIVFPVWMRLVHGKPTTWTRMIIMTYMVCSMFIHFGLERYWQNNSKRISDPNNNELLARAWRWYGVSDTRWLGVHGDVTLPQVSDIFGLEFLAAYLCGPTITLTVLFYFLDSAWAWVIQPVAVTAQAYGLVITWLPAIYEGYASVPQKDAFLYWGLFWGIQSPWLFIPIAMIIHAGVNVSSVFRQAKKSGKKEKTH
ncbi:hypothetical protein PAPYR_5629 [Paratrimastix pyriformis]|uniref:EXPERA domain-containing protein n=1 Tax=Paratrimastix pyriformis TaxID=342808 RepID=A0ABQ8UPM5_9EUKA|nr:hypothetical protein PAPYR_5629 [Paratrimastix pyriformis]